MYCQLIGKTKKRNQNASFLLGKLFRGVEEVEAKIQLSQKYIILYIGVLSKYII